MSMKRLIGKLEESSEEESSEIKPKMHFNETLNELNEREKKKLLAQKEKMNKFLNGIKGEIPALEKSVKQAVKQINKEINVQDVHDIDFNALIMKADKEILFPIAKKRLSDGELLYWYFAVSWRYSVVDYVLAENPKMENLGFRQVLWSRNINTVSLGY